ncbi:MAG: (2Fe-2S)-binding protein [Planctomycetota bacterium]|jgi:carbon-monoxide dehydrogenase small subunit
MEVAFTLNGTKVAVSVRPTQRLIDLLRDNLKMTGTKEGCGEGECGACTVLVDGRVVNACLYPAPEAEGTEITTIEGLLGPDTVASAIQTGFVECGAIQCGFCTPGMIMSAKVLLDARPDPTEDEIRSALVGNLCRCTGYVQIVDAIKRSAELLGSGHE